jgi:hypothetical protein
LDPAGEVDHIGELAGVAEIPLSDGVWMDHLPILARSIVKIQELPLIWTRASPAGRAQQLTMSGFLRVTTFLSPST